MISASPGMTSHGIRARFLQSRSSHWSGSAGAIYPLMSKLTERGFLAVEETRRGSRARRAYTITPAGTKELRRWLGPPLAPWIASVTFDPLRTRMAFMGVASAPKQEVMLEEAIALLETELIELRRERKELTGQDQFWEEMAAEGCLAITQARLRWVRRTLESLRQKWRDEA